MKMIVIGASTGGFEPIEAILSGLPGNIDAAVLVVRHTMPGAPAVLADMLQRTCALPVRTAAEGMRVERGRVYVAPPGHHATLARGGDGARFALRDIAFGERETPSIDLSIVSAAQHFGADCIAVILSGYLDDGTEGAQHLARHGGTTLVQSPADAQVASMPLNVLHRDTPKFALDQHDIAGVLFDLVQDEEPAWLVDSRRPAREGRASA